MSTFSTSLDSLRQTLNPTGAGGPLSLDSVLNTRVGNQKLSELPELKQVLSSMAVDGKIPLETVLTCINSRYDLSGGSLLPKGSGEPLDARDLPLSGLSFMASVMMIMLRQAAEQRRSGQEMRAAQTDMVEKKLLDAAADMRTGAIVALSFSVASGAASIAGGGMGLGTVNAAVNAGSGIDAALSRAQNMSSIATGTSGILKSVGDGAQSMLGAASKEKEAEAERMRSFRDQMVEFNNSLKEYMQGVMQLVQTLVDKENEAMTRIMV